MFDYNLTVSERLSQLLKSGFQSDVEFVLANGEKVKGHRLIFAISSPVFGAMMYGDLAEKGDIEIKDVDEHAFKIMTEFMYSDNLLLDSVSDAISVYEASDKYDLPHLQKLSYEFIKLNLEVDDVIEALEFAEIHEKFDIKDMCLKLMRNETELVLKSENFLDCNVDFLQKIVDEEELNTNEAILFEYIDKWAKHTAQNDGVTVNSLRPLLSSVIGKIRFLTMTANEFIASPYQSQLITAEEKHCLLLNLNTSGSNLILDGLSNCCTSRNGSSRFLSHRGISIKWTKDEVSGMELNEVYYSQTFHVNRNAFKIGACHNIIDNVDYFGLHLCYENHESCSVEFTFKISRNSQEPIVRSASECFSSTKPEIGWTNFISWNNLIASLDNNSILVELDLKLM